MNILIGLLSLVIGAFISFYVFNKKLLNSREENIQLKATLEEKEKSFVEKSKFVDQLKSQVNHDFKALASDILKNDRDKLKIDNSDLLTPLQTQLKGFRDRIETITKEQIEERTSLKEQIKSLHEANRETQQSAQNLTNALTYDNKLQGDWGEEILSSLLSSYGFQEGIEFDLQKQYKSETGEKFKPDVILHLPEGKDVVIDSKVSLKDYVDYVADQTNEEALKKHIASIDNQIKNISIKEYENLEGVRSLDFIFVFIPIEGALLLALQHKHSLFDDALKKNIMLVSPSMLSMSLKTVNFMWQTDKQNKNADEIARQAGKMYDKLAGFFSDLDKIESQLDKTKEGFSDARKKLQTGPGNLIGRAEKLKALGVKSNKDISE
ncbi:DNA recombination protein RmuC [Candidatus Thioglobus sp. NP1]|uniref:DNA recombination protein RmuC n=1 Tax=Candidatus Thioglobus sp. NP1 TaxID=2508687 RepID=UPI000DEE0ABB|nr:DNA recombination protein RmuC [Candidatus Thioglobus sp. NP1]AXE62274.1 DNA recombination protein RmuC [Candidatus Thioglobus sp. NP1]